jgi:hypothetical protein
LSLITEHKVNEDIKILNDVIEQLCERYGYNDQVVRLLSQLAICDEARQHLPVVNSWIRILPHTLVSPKVSVLHLATIKTLFKRQDSVLFEAFSALNILRKFFQKQLAVKKILHFAQFCIFSSGTLQKCFYSRSSVENFGPIPKY